MKTRSDFVSNSSSSSFIVISNKGELQDGSQIARYAKESTKDGVLTLPCEAIGCTEFGWQTTRYYGIGDKLNWAAIVALDSGVFQKSWTSNQRLECSVKTPCMEFKEMNKALKSLCKKHLGIDVRLCLSEYQKGEQGYIDHQSCVTSEPANGRMFQTRKALEDFLFNSHSFIDNSNDNGGRDEVFDEKTQTWIQPKPIPPDYTE